jgi:hypothetical protein
VPGRPDLARTVRPVEFERPGDLAVAPRAARWDGAGHRADGPAEVVDVTVVDRDVAQVDRLAGQHRDHARDRVAHEGGDLERVIDRPALSDRQEDTGDAVITPANGARSQRRVEAHKGGHRIHHSIEPRGDAIGCVADAGVPARDAAS